MSITLDLDGVTTEILINHEDPDNTCPETSLARFHFNKSRLIFDSYSDGCKDVDLVSNEIKVIDTRYRGELRSSIYRVKSKTCKFAYSDGVLYILITSLLGSTESVVLAHSGNKFMTRAPSKLECS